MPMIEGLGDEVTVVLGGFVLFFIVLLAWFSTHTSDLPLLRGMGIIVVELTQRRNRANPQPDTAEHDAAEQDGDENLSEQEVTASESVESNGVDAEVDICPPPQQQGQSTVEGVKPGTSTSAASQANSLPDAAEALTSQMDRIDDTSRSAAAPGGVSETVEATDAVVPPASVVVDETGNRTVSDVDSCDHPSEEEIRRRRVEYFNSNKVPDVLSGTPSDENDASGSGSGKTLGTATQETITQENVPQSNCASPNTNSEPESSSTDTTLRQRVTASSERVHSVETRDDLTTRPSHVEAGEIDSSPSEPSAQTLIRVKLKYMNETQRLVYAKPLDTIGDFRRANFQTELADNKWVRFIYNGQDLRDDHRTLQACSIGDNCTMHCLITAQVRTPPPGEAVEIEDGDDSPLGPLMYPLFTVVLLIVWYLRFSYRQYFSALSTVCLMGISFLLALSYISSLRGPDSPPSTPQPSPPRQHVPPAGQGHPHVD